MTAWLFALPAVALALAGTHMLVRRQGRGAVRLLLTLDCGLLVVAAAVLLFALTGHPAAADTGPAVTQAAQASTTTGAGGAP